MKNSGRTPQRRCTWVLLPLLVVMVAKINAQEVVTDQQPEHADPTFSFGQCLDAATQRAPGTRNRELLEQQQILLEENISAKWLPAFDLNGKASYQSDVVTIEIDHTSIPITFPEMPHDQYSLNIDVQQNIYDGGLSKHTRFYEQRKTEAAIQQIEVETYRVKEIVAGLYFSILAAEENRNNLELMLSNLKAREQALLSSLKNGVVTEKDIKVIRVEILKMLQSLSETDAARNGGIEMLAVYTGLNLGENARLETPFLEIKTDAERQRPEIQYLTLQKETIESGKDLVSAKRMPKIFAFGQAGYGRPGYNMLSTEFDTYYLVGAGLKWKIWDWNITRREKQILELNSQMIVTSLESFNMQMDAATVKEIETMKQLKSNLDLDKKILEMQMEITADAASQLENGVITATEYLLELNKESAARVRESMRKIKLLQSMANYKFYQGTL
jgi:outer membrane protein TolC